MRRRDFITGLGSAATWSLTARAQGQTRPVPLIGAIWAGGSASAPMLVRDREAFQRGLQEDGYVDGRNIALESRYGGKPDDFRRAAEELAQLGPDVIMAGSTPAALAAKRATSTIPVVGVSLADPVADGLVASLARPAGNVTGNTFIGPELGPKRLELMREIVPTATRIAALQHPGVYSESTMRSMLEAIEKKARETGMALQVFNARGPEDFDFAFEAMAKANSEAVMIMPSPVFYVNNHRLVELAASRRLPTIFAYREAVEAGGLLCYGADIADLFRRAAHYVVKILGGAKPGDLPVEQPTKFELLINLNTARTLGLTIPPSLLAQADEVIE